MAMCSADFDQSTYPPTLAYASSRSLEFLSCLHHIIPISSIITIIITVISRYFHTYLQATRYCKPAMPSKASVVLWGVRTGGLW